MTTMSSTRRIAPVSTMVEPAERQRLDAAGVGLYRTIHRDSIVEVLQDLKERHISAVIVSVGRCVREDRLQMAAVVQAFPKIPTLALLSGVGDANAEAVLALGNCGIRTLIDVRVPEGWGRLRALLGREATKDVDRMVRAVLRDDLCRVSDDCWRFFEALFSPDFRVSTVRQLARELNVLPSTLMSRFFRARVPAPKKYLAFARLVRAARLFENPGLSISDVAHHMEYSSPQSFGRHVRTTLRMTAGEFRRRYDGERMFDRFRRELVLPNIERLSELRPLVAQSCVRHALSVLPAARHAVGT